MTSNSRQQASRAFAGVGAMAVAGLGAAVLLGWAFDISVLQRVLPGHVAMKANTALCFLMAGVALRLLRAQAPPAQRTIAHVLSATVLAVGAVTIAEYLTHTNWGLDELLIRDKPLATGLPPGRMAPATALSFLCIGLALTLTRWKKLPGIGARWLCIPPLFMALLAVIGYAYGVTTLYAPSSFVPMALNTALGFVVLSLAVIAVNPTDGFMGILTSDTIGGATARRLLPFTTLLLFVLGWIRLAGQRAGLYDTAFGLALMVIGAIVLTSSVVAWQAWLLHKADLKRRDDDARILALNAVLEQRVEQLGALLPICAWCKRIRDDENRWHSVEEHVSTHTATRFTHAMCPDCARKVEAEATPAG